MVENKKGFYEQIWRSFIRPPRFNYMISDLGALLFDIDGIPVQREDFEVYNIRYQKLKCSLFDRAIPPQKTQESDHFKPCVVYLHCNAGCRVEALPYLDYLITRNIAVCTFDFGACGMSDGEFISLGVHEVDDAEVVIEYIKKFKGVTHVGLWGRSMGAVTALRYASRHRDLVGIIVDSPFSNLRKLAIELSKDRINLPSFLVSGLLAFIKSTIKSKAHFDIKELDIIKSANDIYVTPGFFITSKEDTFVKAHHTEKIYEAYKGPKKLNYVNGNHNEHRTGKMLTEGAQWMEGCFKKYSSTHIFKYEIPKDIKKDHISQLHVREKRKTVENPQGVGAQRFYGNGFSPYTESSLNIHGINSSEKNRGKSVETLNEDDDDYYIEDTDDETEDSVEKGSTRRSSSFITPSYDTRHRDKAMEERKLKLASEGKHSNENKKLKADGLDEFFDYEKHPDLAKSHLEFLNQLSSSSPLYMNQRQEVSHNFYENQMTPQRSHQNTKAETPFKRKSPAMEIRTQEENIPASPQSLTAKNKEMAAQFTSNAHSPRYQADHVNLLENRTPVSVRAGQSSRKKIFEEPRPMAAANKINLVGNSGSPREERDQGLCKNKFAFKNKIPDNDQIKQREIQHMHYFSPNNPKTNYPSEKARDYGINQVSPIQMAPKNEEIKGIRLVQSPDFINKKGLQPDINNNIKGNEYSWGNKTPEKPQNVIPIDDEKIKNFLIEYKANNLLNEIYSNKQGGSENM